jgi:hypothetical protein
MTKKTNEVVQTNDDQELISALGSMNVSQKIRHLDSLGWKRSKIAKFLDKRYQHVRNVLVTPLKTTA